MPATGGSDALVDLADVWTLVEHVLNHPGHSSQKSHGRRGMSAQEFSERFGDAPTGDAALFNVDLVMDRHPGDDRIGGYPGGQVYRSFQSYRHEGEEGFEGINGQLRDGNLSDANQGHVARMDAAFANSHAASDLAVHRGMDDPTAMFGDGYSADRSMVGMEWTDKGYTSTTANRAMTSTFTLDGGISANILIPEGMSAVTLSRSDRESEILLPRNSTFRVVADHGFTVNDQNETVRIIDVEVMT